MGGTIRILCFAMAREATGHALLEWPAPSEGVSVRDLLQQLCEKYPRLLPVLRVSRLVRNGRYLGKATGRLRAGDEFAIHPPYSGG